jgi:hypothetical protein
MDKWWAETLMAVDGVLAPTAPEMFRRTAILFQVLVDRRGWLEEKLTARTGSH